MESQSTEKESFDGIKVLITLTPILCVQIFPQCCHFGVDLRLVRVIVLVLPLESERASDGAEGAVLLVGRLVLLVLRFLPHEAVLVVVSDPDLGADYHHHVGHDLGVVHHD